LERLLSQSLGNTLDTGENECKFILAKLSEIKVGFTRKRRFRILKRENIQNFRRISLQLTKEECSEVRKLKENTSLPQ